MVALTRRGLVGALVAAFALLAPLVAGAAPSATARPSAPSHVTAPAADQADAPVRIVLDVLSPAIPGEDDTLRVRGRVINTSRVPVTDVSVRLRRSSAPLDSRRAVAEAPSALADPVDGDPDDVPLDATRTLVTATLAPGGRASFTLRVPVAELGLGDPGAYVLGIEVLGREAGLDEFDTRKGDLRTFLPWFPTGSEVEPVELVWLWPLADGPDRTADGVLLSNQTPEAISPGGRLDRLVGMAARHRATVSLLADPALLQTADAMTQGYQVRQGSELVIGDREQQARQWLATLADVARQTSIRSLPYADIDASAVNRAGMSNDVVRALTQGPGIATAALEVPSPGDLYWAPFGRIDRSTLNLIASAGVTSLILSADAMPATDAAQPTEGLATAALPTSVGSIRAVLTDPQLSATLALPQRSAADVVAARQAFLADTAVIAQTLPADQSSRAVVVAPPSTRWDVTASLVAPLLRATRTAPWLSALTLGALLARPRSSTSRQRGGYGQKAREAELTQDYMADVAEVSTRLDAFTSIIDDPTGISEPFAEALLRAESSAWRAQPEQGDRLLAAVSAELEEETARVRVLSEGTITLSGDTGRVPVTITNDLDRSVTVGLDLRGQPALRLSSEPLTGIRIEAGRMASVDIDARVVGGDPLPVEVQLLGPEGEEYGEPAEIIVSSTAYARAASWVVAAAFVAILVFVLVGVTRRIRAAHAGRTRGDLGP